MSAIIKSTVKISVSPTMFHPLSDYLKEDWTNSGKTNHKNMTTTRQFW